MHALFFHYVWPSLEGNGPEDVISLVVVGVVGTLLWPPTRRRITAWLRRHLGEEHAELHRKLDHIIREHPDIPPLPDK